MAFQQPTRQAVQRPLQDEADDHETHVPPNVSTALPVDGSQTWVLFSPRAETATTTGTPSVLDSLPASSSQQTAGRSRLSDLGSLQSLNQSNYASSYAQSTYARPSNLRLSLLTSTLSHAHDSNDDSDAVMGDGRPADLEDDAELDSLDSHLPDFRPTQTTGPTALATTAAAVPASTIAAVNLPTHDGLGSFRLGEGLGVSSSVLQEHLYAFEQFNPRRVTKRRRESLDLAQLQAENEFVEDLERTRRIEAWRLEHSRVLLEEIQKETRRRRGSDLSTRRNRPKLAAASAATEAVKPGATSSAWHDQEVDDRLLQQLRGAAGDEKDKKDGLWSQITRKFILEVMGIDDQLLSVLFGETLPDDAEDLSSTPKASSPLSTAAAPAAMTAIVPGTTEAAAAAAATATTEGESGLDESSSSWQMRMLETIAKELGMFMHNHMTAHPGAFSTFTQVQQMPLPYAGLPVIPESTTPPNRHGVLLDDVHGTQRQHGITQADDVTTNDDQTPTGTTASLPRFQPTIHQAQVADKATGPSSGGQSAATTSAATLASPSATTTGFTQEEWEQDLDIKLVFRYLRSRFFSGASSSSSHAHRHHHMHHHSLGSNGSGSLNMQDAAAKAARVRQHHPLVGRSAARQAGDRRSVAPAYRGINPAVATPSSPLMGLRAATSCASQSTRRSARRSSVSSRHSSRHYWDIGGSIGTGSMIASVGPMGSWGEL